MGETKLTPRKARTLNQICDLPRDNVGAPGYGIMVEEGEVYLSAQEWGEHPTESIRIPRKVFDAFVDWYNEGTVPTALMRADDRARRAAIRKVVTP